MYFNNDKIKTMLHIRPATLRWPCYFSSSHGFSGELPFVDQYCFVVDVTDIEIIFVT